MTCFAAATQVVDSTDAVAETEWDALVAPGDLFGRHAWLRHLDLATGCPHRAVVSYDGTALVGVLPCWENTVDHDDLFSLLTFFPDVPGDWKHRPFSWLGTRRSVRNGLIVTGSGDRAATLERLLATALEVATAEGRAGVVLPYLPHPAAVEFAGAHPAARMMLHSADATVRVPPGGANDLFQQASRHNRTRRRKELREFTENGYSLEWVDLTSAIAEELAPLIASTRRKHGNDNGSSWMRRVFAAQRHTGILADAKAVLCRRHGRIAFATVFYRHADSLHARYFGADETVTRDGHPYFVMNFHTPVDYGAREGFSRILLSVSSLEAKVRRGARLDPLAAVVVPAYEEIDENIAWAHNQRFAREFRERFGGHPEAMGDEWLKFLPDSA